MPEYLPLARKYRPSDFAGLIGQEISVRSLNRSIEEGRIAQGYLLSGIRGVGKTSVARIIAKTVNCEKPLKKNSLIIPCGKCPSCEGIDRGSHPDVTEMDAASSTGVDDVRKSIIEGSEYRPVLSKYKVFIIDEVHMLSKNAFNALLKTLEEPPPGVIFILATTELGKIPATVASRCRKYELRRLSVKEIVDLLKEISEKEGIEAEENALKALAVKSEGSARDAVTLLDTARSFGADKITAQIAYKITGSTDLNFIIDFAEYLIKGDAEKALGLVEKIYYEGADLCDFLSSVSDFLAHSIKKRIAPSYRPAGAEYFGEGAEALFKDLSLPKLSILWRMVLNSVGDVKNSRNPLAETETAVIKTLYSQNIPTPADLLASGEGVPGLNSFMKYLLEKKEFDVYYSLLNEVEIAEFFENKILVKATEEFLSKKRNFSKALENALFSWDGKKRVLTIQKEEKVTNLRERLEAGLKKSDYWKIIEEAFPGSSLEISFK